MDPRTLDQRLRFTIDWWAEWSKKIAYDAKNRAEVVRSARYDTGAFDVRASFWDNTATVVPSCTPHRANSARASSNWCFRRFFSALILSFWASSSCFSSSCRARSARYHPPRVEPRGHLEGHRRHQRR